MGVMKETTTPRPELSPVTVAALTVECPSCHAGPGSWCQRATTGKRASTLHSERFRAAPVPDAAGDPDSEVHRLAAEVRRVAGQRDDLQAQLSTLAADLASANGSLAAASRGESALAAELQELRPKVRAAEDLAARLGEQARIRGAELDEARKALDTARRACDAAAERISDLERQLAKAQDDALAAKPAKVTKLSDAGWERAGARSYLEAKFHQPVKAMRPEGIANLAERWLWAVATGNKVLAEGLAARISERWAQIHANCG